MFLPQSDQVSQWCVYVCMYVCIYVCMYVYIYIYMCVCVCVCGVELQPPAFLTSALDDDDDEWSAQSPLI